MVSGHLLNKQEQHYYRSLEHSTTYFYYLLIRYQHFLKNRNACPHIWWVHWHFVILFWHFFCHRVKNDWEPFEVWQYSIVPITLLRMLSGSNIIIKKKWNSEYWNVIISNWSHWLMSHCLVDEQIISYCCIY